MATADRPCTRDTNRKEPGFYKKLLEDQLDGSESYNEKDIAVGEDNVFEVERLLELKNVKGITYYFVLWKDYPKEDASWIPASQITDTAIRMFHDPQPPLRTVLDAVSSFVFIIHSSLHAGIIARRTVSLEFPKFVFDFLFKNKGSTVRHKPGRLFERNDFPSPYFKDSDFISHNKFGEGHFIFFPIYMYSHLKFAQQNYDSKGKTLPRCFTETLSLKLVKQRV